MLRYAAMEPVTLINPVEVTEEQEVAFLESWIQIAHKLREQGGLLSLGLHRSIDPFSRFRFVIVEQWQSEEAVRAASQSLGGPNGHHEFPCTHFPGLYRLFSK